MPSYWDLTDTDSARVSRWASLGSNNPNDSWGAHNLTWSGASAYSTAPFEGTAFDIAANNTILNLTGQTASSLGVAGNVTLVGWVRTPSSSGYKEIFGFRGFTDAVSLEAAKYDELGARIVGGQWDYPSTSGFLYTPNTWHLVGLTCDGTTANIYNGGTLGGTDPASSYDSAAFFIGGRSAAENRWDGQIADVRVYSRILSGADLAEIAAGPEPTNTVAPVASFSGGVLSCTTGTWNGYSNGTITYAYQWQSYSGSWSNVSGATSSTYTPTLALDYRCAVTATNNGGSHVAANSNTVTVTLGGTRRYTNYLTTTRYTNYKAA
jgi:hypothetical protein